ncbi:hypothetical protein K8I28_12355 [bacterium]|nr:hypothetical protein [bacterium]
MSEEKNSLEFDVYLKLGRNGRQQLRMGKKPDDLVLPIGRIPRVSKLIALAHRMAKMVQDGEVDGYAELARIGHVSRARITQIMNLLLLAPDIQEEVLFLPNTVIGHDKINLHHLLSVTKEVSWSAQRRKWEVVNSELLI